MQNTGPVDDKEGNISLEFLESNQTRNFIFFRNWFKSSSSWNQSGFALGQKERPLDNTRVCTEFKSVEEMLITVLASISFCLTEVCPSGCSSDF